MNFASDLICVNKKYQECGKLRSTISKILQSIFENCKIKLGSYRKHTTWRKIFGALYPLVITFRSILIAFSLLSRNVWVHNLSQHYRIITKRVSNESLLSDFFSKIYQIKATNKNDFFRFEPNFKNTDFVALNFS